MRLSQENKIALARQKRNKKIVKQIKTDFENCGFSNSLLKFVSLLLLISLNIGFVSVPSTKAFYNDLEKSEDNIFAAGAIDFVLSDSGFNSLQASLNFEESTTTSKLIGLALESVSNPIKYTASSSNFGGDTDFCQAININADLNNENQFSGLLLNFISSATTTIGAWQYDFYLLPDAHFYNKVCSFDFEYNGRQTFPHQEYENGGFYDTEKISNNLSSWGFRINKVFYDVDSIHGSNPENEWVEIHNQTDQDLDLNNWQICDNNKCSDISSTSPIMIPAKGFGVITASSTTWNYWEIKENVVKILLDDTKIGNGLADSGDRLILKRPDGVIIDEMGWKTDTAIWNPAAKDVAKGHVLGRTPAGFDTNSPNDFSDLSIPLVVLINPDQSGNLTWYWTYKYDITWSATNPNGSNDDLTVDLSYIKDTNQDQNLSLLDDEVVSIAKNLPNTGTYKWTVPSGFLGYIWIKISVFGDNPMLNTSMISGKIYDPYPIELVLSDPQTVLESIVEVMNNVTDTPPEPVQITEEEPIQDTEEPPQEEVITEETVAVEPQEIIEEITEETVEEVVEEVTEETSEEIVEETTEEIIPESMPAETVIESESITQPETVPIISE